MLDYEAVQEVDRVRNLVTNFGWEIIKQKIDKDDLELTIKKEIVRKTLTEEVST